MEAKEYQHYLDVVKWLSDIVEEDKRRLAHRERVLKMLRADASLMSLLGFDSTLPLLPTFRH